MNNESVPYTAKRRDVLENTPLKAQELSQGWDFAPLISRDCPQGELFLLPQRLFSKDNRLVWVEGLAVAVDLHSNLSVGRLGRQILTYKDRVDICTGDGTQS